MVPSVEDLQWAAGHFDGDGCVYLRRKEKTYVLTVTVKKAVKGGDSAAKFQKWFGGSLSTPVGVVDWTATHNAAATFCQVIEPYVILKHAQVQLALQVTNPERCNHPAPLEVTNSQNGELLHCQSKRELARILQISRPTLDRWIAQDIYPTTLKNVNWVLQTRPVAQTLSAAARAANVKEHSNRAEVYKQLQNLKKQTHSPVNGPLPLAYIAGLIDADGCIQAARKGRSIKLTFTQKYPAMCLALRKQFGGSVYTSATKTCSNWTIQAGADAVMQLLLPFLVEKKRQAAIAVSIRTASLEQVALSLLKKELSELKGNQGKRRERT